MKVIENEPSRVSFCLPVLRPSNVTLAPTDQWGLVSPRNLDGKPSKPNELMVVSACSQSVADYLPSINNVLGSD